MSPGTGGPVPVAGSSEEISANSSRGTTQSSPAAKCKPEEPFDLQRCILWVVKTLEGQAKSICLVIGSQVKGNVV